MQQSRLRYFYLTQCCTLYVTILPCYKKFTTKKKMKKIVKKQKLEESSFLLQDVWTFSEHVSSIFGMIFAVNI